VKRALDTFFGGCVALAALFMVAIALLILAQSLSRLFGGSVPDANELAGFSVAATTFLGLGPTLRNGGHIRVNLVIAQLPEAIRRWLELVALAVSLALAGYFTWWSADLAWGAYVYGEVSPGVLAFPLWIPQTGMAFGLFGLCVALAEALVLTLRGELPGYRRHENELTE